eukprot:358017-Chlamydomonas_euryale.AAC.6
MAAPSPCARPHAMAAPSPCARPHAMAAPSPCARLPRCSAGHVQTVVEDAPLTGRRLDTMIARLRASRCGLSVGMCRGRPAF